MGLTNSKELRISRNSIIKILSINQGWIKTINDLGFSILLIGNDICNVAHLAKANSRYQNLDTIHFHIILKCIPSTPNYSRDKYKQLNSLVLPRLMFDDNSRTNITIHNIVKQGKTVIIKKEKLHFNILVLNSDINNLCIDTNTIFFKYIAKGITYAFLIK